MAVAYSVFGLTQNLSDLNDSNGARVYVSQTHTCPFSLDVDAMRLSENFKRPS